MGLYPPHLRSIIEDTLTELNHGMNTPAAVELLMMTAATESHLGTYLRQLGDGPAIGIYQMEPATHDDIWRNYLRNQKLRLLQGVLLEMGSGHAEDMEWNLKYATAMARLHYRRVPEPLPDADDVEGLAAYWKSHYNTRLGAGTVAGAIMDYSHYALGGE